MRLIGRFPDQRQVGALIDSLRNIGLDRGDMIISDMNEIRGKDTYYGGDYGEDNTGGIEHFYSTFVNVKSERDELGENEPFIDGIRGLKGREGIVVAVKAPKHESSKIREIMEQSGALEIVQD